MPRSILASAALAACLAAGAANAEPVRYTIDPSHTYPSFEADHMGMSYWRGKFNRNSGHVLLDRANNTGSVEVEIDIASVDFGHDRMNEHAVKPDLLDAAQFPTATYRGTLADFHDGKPTRVDGELSLHGVTRPLALEIVRFHCKPHPMKKVEFCGADARANFQRDDFGIAAGKDWGFDMRVDLRIQVEAVAEAAKEAANPKP
jgi:polyisoprenoid-binding protein YceI